VTKKAKVTAEKAAEAPKEDQKAAEAPKEDPKPADPSSAGAAAPADPSSAGAAAPATDGGDGGSGPAVVRPPRRRPIGGWFRYKGHRTHEACDELAGSETDTDSSFVSSLDLMSDSE